MTATALAIVAVVVLAAAVLLVPLGLPGTWIQLAVLLVGALAGRVGWTTWVVLVGVAAAVEVAEFLILRGMGARFGGSRRAFWGAVAGGFLGLFVGLPVPLIGPLLTAFLGTFAGAFLVTWLETRSAASASRVGWGVVLARTLSVALKTGAAVGILAVGAGALLFFP